jgi:hypothetical protein
MKRHSNLSCSGQGAPWSVIKPPADQQALSSLGVAAGLDDLVEYVTVLIDGAPEPMSSSADRHSDLVKMPNIPAGFRHKRPA